MEAPFVSIVIPVLNGAATLPDLLTSLDHLEQEIEWEARDSDSLW